MDPSGHFGILAILAVAAVSAVVLTGCSEIDNTPQYQESNSETAESSSQVTTSMQTAIQAAKDSAATTVSPKNNNSVLTNEQKMFASVLYAEAGANYVSNLERQYVAHSMYNRIGYGEWKSKNNIIDVITQSGQYDGYGKGENAKYKAAMQYYESGIWENSNERLLMDDCLGVVKPILDGSQKDITGNVVFFHSFDNPNDWRYHNYYVHVPVNDMVHHFYRWE